MISDDELQKMIEEGRDAEDGNFKAYKMVFDGLKTTPKNLELDSSFTRSVIKRLEMHDESSTVGNKFWFVFGVFALTIACMIAIALTPSGFKIFESFLELKWYIVVFALITLVFQKIEKRLILV